MGAALSGGGLADHYSQPSKSKGYEQFWTQGKGQNTFYLLGGATNFLHSIFIDFLYFNRVTKDL